ncbi:MAG: hypothetical protein GXP27_12825 [Planctomycetes bacterium]|nr:hypothetical protein [Planctomycetota bacterium]
MPKPLGPENARVMHRWDGDSPICVSLVRIAVIIAAGCGSRATLPAADIQPTPPERLVPYGERQVDGQLSDWDMQKQGWTIAPERVGKDGAVRVFSNDPGNPIRGAADLSARVALAWNERFLFIAAAVRDDDLRGIRPGKAHNVGPAGWACDSVMLQIHSFRQPMKPNSPYSKTPLLALRYEAKPGGRGRLIEDARALDRADGYWKLPEGSQFVSRETQNGYVVEAAVPWSALGYRPQAGEVLLGAFLVADVDSGEKLNQLGWHHAGEPRALAVFRLMKRPEVTALLSLSRRRIPAGSRCSVHYRVDARAADVRIERLELVAPANDGKPAISVPVGVNVPKGRTASDVLVIDAMPGATGRFSAQLVGRTAGDEWVLAAEEFEIVPPKPPAPAVQNSPGEVHHQRPDRVAHGAYEDYRRGVLRFGFIKDRSGYERYILTHVKDYIDRHMESFLKGRSRYIDHQVLMSYVLHKVTGEPRYAEWTRRGIELALALQKEKLDVHHLLRLVPVRYHIWLHDPQTPLAPPDAEETFQELWARAVSEYDKKWMFAEWGYHNRCYHRWAVLKIARHFARKLNRPVLPQVDEYIAFHDAIIKRFGPPTDNSSGYHWVAFRYPVYWALATDTLPELAKHKGWVSGLSRWRRYSSPSGAVPNFGDTSGWASGAATAMLRYELMAWITRDGRFRWQAHRIAEWHYNHFWPRHDQYHLPRDRTALHFCLAWLWSDDAVNPVPPQPASTVTFRTRVVETTEAERLARPGLSLQKMVDEQVPDKLVLSSGNDPRRLWGLVELLDRGGHCGRLPGNFICLLQHDAVLLAGQGYYERSAEFNNILWIEDRDGIAVDPRPMRVELPAFVDDPAVTWARIRVRRFEQMPVTYVRDIVFVKNAFVLVKDRITFHATMRVRVGPCWQTRDLGPQCGDDWFNTYYEWLYHTGLGLGRGVHAFRNPAWDLLVRFAPRSGTEITVLDRYNDNPYRPSPTQLRQSWSGIVRAGDTKTFTTILLPHGPAFDVRQFADWARFVQDDDNTTLVRVTTEEDNINHLRRSHWVLLQESPEMVAVGGFKSDARLSVLSTDHRGRWQPAVLVDGTTVSIGGTDYAAKARRPKIGTLFEIDEP